MIPFIDLNSQYQAIKVKVQKRVIEVLDSGQYIMGPEIEKIEEQLNAFSESKYCISCASGTDALVMALYSKGVKPGDYIITTPFTFIATAESILLVGAIPIFIDIDPHTYNLSPQELEKALGNLNQLVPKAADKNIKDHLKGIIAVDLFGLPSEYEKINTIAQQHNLFVIADAAQSYGAQSPLGKVGQLAEITTTSFFPAKPLGAYGDGGAVFTDDEALAQALKSIRVHGQGTERYQHTRIGITGRLDAIQAVVLQEKLPIFNDELTARNKVAAYYHQKLAATSLITQTIPEGYQSAWAQYCIQAKDTAQREALMAALNAADIPAAIYYPIPLHLQPVFQHLGYTEGDFPICEAISKKIFAIPMHPYLDTETMDSICDTLYKTLEH